MVRRWLPILLVCVFLVGLVGCGKTMDATNQKTYEASIAEMHKELSGENKIKLTAALLTIVADIYKQRDKAKEAGEVVEKTPPGEMLPELRDRIHGKTAPQIIAMANAIDEK